MELSLADNRRPGKKERAAEIAAETLIAWLLSGGFVLGIVAAFGIPADTVLILSAALAGALAASVAALNRKTAAAVLITLTGLALLTALLFSGVILEGVKAAFNFAGEALGKTSSLRLKEYALAGSSEVSGGIAAAAAVLAALLGAIGSALLHRGIRIGLIVPAAALLFLIEVTTIKVPLVPCLLTVSAGVMAAGYGAAVKGNGASSKYRMAAAAAGIMVLLFGAGVLAAAILASPDGYMRNEAARAASEKIDEAIRKARYGGDSGGLAGGKLTGLGKRDPKEETSLVVTMSKPESMYLKGFVGSMLTAAGWETLEEKTYYGSDDLFYGLHENGFRGNAQLSAARATLRKSRLADESITFSVENKKASSEYMYLPYELEAFDEKTKDRSDETAASRGLFGKRKYGGKTNGNLVKDFPDLTSQVYLARSEKDAYTKSESWYNKFVYQNYLAMPKAAEELLRKELGYRGSRKNGHIDYYAAIEKIIGYLDDHVIYTDLAGSYEGDFLTGFLSAGKGRAVHYATAAALMFRYYGIPARYVEGYVITPEDVKKAGKRMEIPAENAHAWPEIYLDGTGWVPVEVTPYMRDIMEQPDYRKGLQADSTTVAKKPKSDRVPEKQSDADRLKKIAKAAFLSLAELLLLLLIAFDIFAVLFFLATSVLRLLANRRRKKAFSQEDNRLAVCSMVGYMTSLAKFRSPWIAGSDVSGISRSFDENYEGGLSACYMDAMAVGRKAKFSGQEITDGERNAVARAKDRTLEEVKKQEDAYSRWVMKYIERLC